MEHAAEAVRVVVVPASDGPRYPTGQTRHPPAKEGGDALALGKGKPLLVLDHVRGGGDAAVENVVAARLDHLGQVRRLDHFVRHQAENLLRALAHVARAREDKRHRAQRLGQLAALQRLAHLRHRPLGRLEARVPAQTPMPPATTQAR